MKTISREGFMAFLLFLFIVGIGLSVYLHENPFIIEELEVLKITGETEETEEVGPAPEVDGDPDPGVEPARAFKPVTTRIAETAPQTGRDFFVEYRMDRERVRSRQVELLREILDNDHAEEELKKDAHRALLTMLTSMEREHEIENLIRAKNLKDALAFVGPDRVDVVVKATELDENRVRKIADVVNRTTGVRPANIAVIAYQ